MDPKDLSFANALPQRRRQSDERQSDEKQSDERQSGLSIRPSRVHIRVRTLVAP